MKKQLGQFLQVVVLDVDWLVGEVIIDRHTDWHVLSGSSPGPLFGLSLTFFRMVSKSYIIKKGYGIYFF